MKPSCLIFCLIWCCKTTSCLCNYCLSGLWTIRIIYNFQSIVAVTNVCLFNINFSSVQSSIQTSWSGRFNFPHVPPEFYISFEYYILQKPFSHYVSNNVYLSYSYSEYVAFSLPFFLKLLFSALLPQNFQHPSVEALLWCLKFSLSSIQRYIRGTVTCSSSTHFSLLTEFSCFFALDYDFGVNLVLKLFKDI